MEAWQNNPASHQPMSEDIQVFFTVNRDGSVSQPVIHQSSGNLNYDEAALNTVTSISPRPPLPDYYTMAPVMYSIFLNALQSGAISPEAYVQEVKEKALSYWRPPFAENTQAVIVRLKINRDGRAEEAVVTQSSGNKDYDDSVLEAIAQASPFAAFPREFQSSALGVELSFHYGLQPAVQH